LNARRPHIKSEIGYKNGDKHNSRINSKGQEFIKFSRLMSNKRRSKASRPLTMSLILMLMLLMFLMSYHDFDASYILMRNKIGKIITLHVEPHHKRSKTCVWVPKCLITNLRGPNQTWYLKQKPNLFCRLTPPMVQVGYSIVDG
jgi:hypothetical protein